jgi:hypothetical protein
VLPGRLGVAGRDPQGDRVRGVRAGEDHVAGQGGVQLLEQPGTAGGGGDGWGVHRGPGPCWRARAAARRFPPCSSTA